MPSVGGLCSWWRRTFFREEFTKMTHRLLLLPGSSCSWKHMGVPVHCVSGGPVISGGGLQWIKALLLLQLCLITEENTDSPWHWLENLLFLRVRGSRLP